MGLCYRVTHEYFSLEYLQSSSQVAVWDPITEYRMSIPVWSSCRVAHGWLCGTLLQSTAWVLQCGVATE